VIGDDGPRDAERACVVSPSGGGAFGSSATPGLDGIGSPGFGGEGGIGSPGGTPGSGPGGMPGPGKGLIGSGSGGTPGECSSGWRFCLDISSFLITGFAGLR